MNRGPVNLFTGFGRTNIAVGCAPACLHVASRAPDPETAIASASENDAKMEASPAPHTDLNAAPTNRKLLLYGAFFLILCYIVLKD